MTLTTRTKDRPVLEIRTIVRDSFRWINESITNIPHNYILTVKYEKGQIKHHFKTFHDAVRETPGKLILRRRTDCRAMEPQRHLQIATAHLGTRVILYFILYVLIL